MPVRTCLACGTRCEKKDLLRFVADPLIGVVGDVTKTNNGRGYYLHPELRCLSSIEGWNRIVGKANRFLKKIGETRVIERLNFKNIVAIMESSETIKDIKLCQIINVAIEDLKRMSNGEFLDETNAVKRTTNNLMLPKNRNRFK